MDESPAAHEVDAVAADLVWLRKLALALVHEPSLAEDACQEAWLAAHRKLHGARPSRAWLATVVRRVAYGFWRSATRRRRRELATAVSPSSPPGDELVARREMHQRLLDQVQALDPGLRTVTSMHFLEGASVRDIACHLACPEDTVRWRLRHAMGLLRKRLARDFGPDWQTLLIAAALPGLSGGATAASTVVAAPVAMGVAVKLHTVGVLGLVLVSSCVVFWWSTAGHSSSLDPVEDRAALLSPGAIRPGGQQGADPDAPAAADGPERRRVPHEPKTAAERSAGLTLAGTFVVVDEFGIEHPLVDGTFELVVWNQRSGNSETVPVQGGRWQHELPTRPDRLTVRGARIGGRLASCAGMPEVLEAQPAVVHLVGRWLPRLRLRVLGDDTGADLRDCQVLTDPTFTHYRVHPEGQEGLDELLVHGDSPLEIEPTMVVPSQWFWVAASGYAWQRVELLTDQLGERMVRLHPAGALEVVLSGGTAPPGSRVRIASGQGPSRIEIAEARHRDGVARIQGLAPGPVDLALVIGTTEPVVVAKATATIVPGSLVTTTLHIDPDFQRPPGVAVAGTLEIDPAWSDPGMLWIEARGSTQTWFPGRCRLQISDMQEIAPGIYRWDAGTLPAGNYQAQVTGMLHRAVFRVPGSGDVEIRLEVPAPSHVRVRVLDQDSGAVIDPRGWKVGYYSDPPGHGGPFTVLPSVLAADGWFQFKTTPGRTTLLAEPEGYHVVISQVEVGAGNPEFELKARRACGIVLALRDRDTLLPWPEELQVQLLDSTGECVAIHTDRGRVPARVPGKLRLVLGDVPGYQAVPEREVQIGSGEWLHLEIQLVRRP